MMNKQHQTICDECVNEKATLICDECEQAFCDACDSVVHTPAGLRRHLRKPLPKMCQKCSIANANGQCVECNYSYCSECFESFHQKGSRKRHRFNENDKDESVELEVIQDDTYSDTPIKKELKEHFIKETPPKKATPKVKIEKMITRQNAAAIERKDALVFVRDTAGDLKPLSQTKGESPAQQE
eukprot:Selendium_serpulae@DN3423_c0_g1_i1.p1